MDLATVIGLVLAWGALLGALLMEGGELRVMINLPAALLVFGGTIGAAVISFRMNQLMEVPSILSIAFREKTLELPDVIRQLVRLAEKARRDGLLSLEEESRRFMTRS